MSHPPRRVFGQSLGRFLVLAGSLAVNLFSMPLPTAMAQSLRFEPESIDIGPISDASPVTRQIRITNITERRVKLVLGYCHLCDAPVLSRDSLLPGESAELLLEIKPVGKRDRVAASATIAVEGTQEQTNVEAVAIVRPRLWLDPPVMFLRPGRDGYATLTVHPSAGPPTDAKQFRVAKAETDVPDVIVQVGESEVVQDLGEAAIRVEIAAALSPTSSGGQRTGAITLTTSDQPPTTVTIGLDINAGGLARLEPENRQMVATVNQPFEAWFDVEPSDAWPVVVESIGLVTRDEASSVAFDAERLPGGKSVRVWVRGIAPARTKNFAKIDFDISVRSSASPRATGAERLTLRGSVGLMVRPEPNGPPPQR